MKRDPSGGHGGGCADPTAPPALSLAEARAIVLSRTVPLSDVESVPLRDALGRVLAVDVLAPFDIPAHTNSAVDGYALRGEDLNEDGAGVFRLLGEAFAGRPFDGAWERGGCVLVTTGAVMPADTDTAVMRERTRRVEEGIDVEAGQRAGQNVRAAGEDLRAGELALGAGQIVAPPEIGLLAAMGIGDVQVLRRPRVAFFSTGDELRPVGEPLEPGQVYDSNRHTLHALVTQLGAEAIDLGVVADERESLRLVLESASRQADVVLTTGGVSVGEADYVKDVLADLGSIEFWRVAIQPGRPIVYGQLGGAHFFGLPGNPVAVMVTFYQIVTPALRRLRGEPLESAAEPPLRLRARARSSMRKLPHRVEVKRGVLTRDASGEYHVDLAGQQGSGILSSMTRANCFIVLPHDRDSVDAGDWVEVEPFAAFV